MLEVRIERIPSGVSEKKILNPTMKMLEFALRNAGFSEGVWVIKAPHRTRKKGSERFRAIRMESAGFRIRCKPGGNDTCYEWTLCPPSEMDQESVFSELCSLHPNTMRSTKSIMEDSGAIKGLFNRVFDSEPPVVPPKKVNLEEEERGFAEELDSLEDTETPPKEIAAETGPSMETVESIAKIDSLDISMMKKPLSSDYAMDRALLAFEMLAGDSSFMRRNQLSEGLTRLLNLEGLAANSHIYGSVKGAMRALLMACCSSEYMERIMYGENSTNGYRLTEKGKDRLAIIKPLALIDLSPHEVVEVAEKPKQQKADKISALKELIAEHESVNKGIDELQQLIGELECEAEDEELRLSGLNKVLAEKTMASEELTKEIARLREKLEFLQAAAKKRDSDMDELKKEMDELCRKKMEIESRLD